MSRIAKCLDFELKYLGKGTAAFLVIYFSIYLFLTISLNTGNSRFESNSSFIIAGTIYAFVYIASSYKQQTNYLLMFGNTRKSIVLSSFISYAALSVLFSIISMISAYTDKTFAAINGNNTQDIFDLLYPGESILARFVWYVSFYVMTSAFSMLYGSLAYKYGKTFMIAFWVGLGFLLFFLPTVNNPKNLVDALGIFFRVGNAGGGYLASVNFLITAVLFGAGSWIAARRQSLAA